jgi:hypothetical protein
LLLTTEKGPDETGSGARSFWFRFWILFGVFARHSKVKSCRNLREISKFTNAPAFTETTLSLINAKHGTNQGMLHYFTVSLKFYRITTYHGKQKPEEGSRTDSLSLHHLPYLLLDGKRQH